MKQKKNIQMPICSDCHESKEFSSAQLKKKSAERKCVDCVHVLSFEDQRAELCKWLTSHGAELNISISKNSDNYRWLSTNKRLGKNQTVVFIPQQCMMTMTDALTCEFVTQISGAASHTVLALYLLQEKKKSKDSFFYPYIALLPKKYDVPIHWSNDKVKELNGTIGEHMLKMKKHALLTEYKALNTNLISFEEFQWARTVVITRVFSCKMTQAGKDVECLVPIADMMNHDLEPNVTWSFDNDLNGFQMESLKCILTNSQLHDSYGEKCNSRWLINYAFTIPQNHFANQSSFFFPNPFREMTSTDDTRGTTLSDIICQRNFDDSFSGYNYCIQNQLESRVSQNLDFRFQVSAILEKTSKSNLDLISKMFGFARCCCLDFEIKDNTIIISNGTVLQLKDNYIYDINPMLNTNFISEENEIKAIELIGCSARQTLDLFKDSLDNNIKTLITGEKAVLQFYCDLQDFVKTRKFSALRKSETFRYYWTLMKK
jgi:hypothetical protein